MNASGSWRVFFLKVGCCMLALALASSFAYRYSAYFQREQRYREVVSDIASHPDASIIFAGDSHIAELGNELLGRAAYNVAFGGDSLRECYAKLLFLLSQPDTRIKFIVVSADYHMFGNGRRSSANRSFADYYFLSTHAWYGLEKNLPSTVMDRVPLFNDDYVQYLRESLSRFRRGNATNDDDSGGWQLLPEAARNQIAAATGRGDHEGVSGQSEGIRWYERLVALARERGVTLVAVRMPAADPYFASLTPEAMQAVDAGLSRAGVGPIHDFRHAFHDPSLFQDPDHLNEAGTVAFLRLFQNQTGLPVTHETRIATETEVPVGSRSR